MSDSYKGNTASKIFSSKSMSTQKECKKILICHDGKRVVDDFRVALENEECEIHFAPDGETALTLIDAIKPQLIFAQLMLPKVHGMDLLKMVRQHAEVNNAGFILAADQPLVQDYQIAVQQGVDYFMLPPYSHKSILSLVHRYVDDELYPAPFVDPYRKSAPSDYYHPENRVMTSYFKFWGTRGSVPVSGPEYYRYGGNTPCLEVRDGKDLVIIDAGTGIRGLGQEVLNTDITDIHLFISHTHWDHIIGFPFFYPVHDKRYKIHIYAARGFRKSVQELFMGMLDHDYFPVQLDEMHAEFIFHDITGKEPVTIGQIQVYNHYATHPGATLCFKFKTPNKSVGYATDNEVFIGYHGNPNDVDENHYLAELYRGMIEFYSDCEIMIHEAQYSPEEYRNKVGWGHSSMSNAALFMKLCRTKEWMITHHDPEHTDQIVLERLQLQRDILRDCNIPCRVFMAWDGLSLPL